nr:uncharacterized protein LOC105847245 [Hydra vulgaris]
MKNKTYNTSFSKELYDDYKVTDNKEEFIKEYLEKEKENGVTTKLDFYCLLLCQAIEEQDKNMVKNILQLHRAENYPQLLTNVNKHHMSPLVFALLFNDTNDIKDIIRDLLNQLLNEGYYFQKVILTREAFLVMYEVIGFQGEAYLECVDDFLKPLVVDEEVSIIREYDEDLTLPMLNKLKFL